MKTILSRVFMTNLSPVIFIFHGVADLPVVNAAKEPRNIHDFSGFPQALDQMGYPAPSASELANRVVDLLNQATILTNNPASFNRKSSPVHLL
jgi:aromatic ring-opening dioxygenase catalytic subunit (LigB family)